MLGRETSRNEVIWPNARFHRRAEETVRLPLTFPTPSYRSYLPSLSFSHTHILVISPFQSKEVQLTLDQV